MKSVPENIYRLVPQFPWSTECLTLHPELPSGHIEGQQLQQHRIQSLHWKVANAPGKCQFVVDSHLGAS